MMKKISADPSSVVYYNGTTKGLSTAGRASGALSHKLFAA